MNAYSYLDTAHAALADAIAVVNPKEAWVLEQAQQFVELAARMLRQRETSTGEQQTLELTGEHD